MSQSQQDVAVVIAALCLTFWLGAALCMCCQVRPTPRQQAARIRAGLHLGQSQGRRRPIILSVEGIIGAGKSTLLRCVQQQLGPRVHVVQEGVELWRAVPDPTQPGTHNLLQQYYQDAAKYAVSFQTFTLATRAAALHDALQAIAALPQHEKPGIVLVERSSSGDACFASMLYKDGVINTAWYAAYRYMHALYERFVPAVDGIIDMNVPVATAMDRLRERARGEETGVTAAYQEHLYDTIQDWLINEPRPVMILDPMAWDGAHVNDRKASELARRIVAFADTIA